MCDAGRVSVATVIAVITIEFGIRKLSAMGVQSVSVLLLVTDRIAVRYAVYNYIRRPLDAYEEKRQQG